MESNDKSTEPGILARAYLVLREVLRYALWAYIFGTTLECIYHMVQRGEDTTYTWGAVGALAFVARIELTKYKWPWE